jgi:surface polysaccharide O-acyltransferase-like enzyme
MSNNTFFAKAKTFFCHPFWSDWRTIATIYALIPIIMGILKWNKACGTYLIYKSVFWNTIHQLPLYDFYDYLGGDCNHYGPIFAYVFAPFALLPDQWGVLLWEIFLVATFFIAVCDPPSPQFRLHPRLTDCLLLLELFVLL